ncbi:MAG: hypothetical protein GXO74_10420 [Calditrichaeota bacterium]|nr:hypothetical protein [Calditrichota bacterium]
MRQLNSRQKTALWLIAIVITLASIVYQKMTGPTYPVRTNVTLNGKNFKYRLLRSHDTNGDAVIDLNVPDSTYRAIYQYRRYHSKDLWTTDTLKAENNIIRIAVPKQPAAGKVMYKVSLLNSDGKTISLTEAPIIIRFKGAVPLYVLIPHIFFMFFAMLISTRTGLEALANGSSAYKYAWWSFGLLFIGGMILGPLVQKFAFDAFWTGWPFGHDLTDNKTFLALIFWGIALWRHKKTGDGRKWFVIAAVVQFFVYLIPHSALGSEIDYTKVPQ